MDAPGWEISPLKGLSVYKEVDECWNNKQTLNRNHANSAHCSRLFFCAPIPERVGDGGGGLGACHLGATGIKVTPLGCPEGRAPRLLLGGTGPRLGLCRSAVREDGGEGAASSLRPQHRERRWWVDAPPRKPP